MYEHIKDDIIDQIPEKCLSCPNLAARMALHNSFLGVYDKNRRTINPFQHLAAMADVALSNRRLNIDVRDMLPEMKDCEGVLEYPIEDKSYVDICGITAREALASQIEE